MYNDINTKFKEQSRQLNNMIAFVSIPTILIMVALFFSFWIHHFHWAEWIEIVLYVFVVAFIFSFLYIVVLFSIRKEPNFSWKKCWRILFMIDLYLCAMHEKDINILIQLLKSHEVNTRPKVLEVLRHYQCLLPRKTIGSSHIISIVALCISTLAFVFSENFSTSFQNQIISIISILMILIIYYFVYGLNKYVFHYFGESALYERIESALSEIWIKSLIK